MEGPCQECFSRAGESSVSGHVRCVGRAVPELVLNPDGTVAPSSADDRNPNRSVPVVEAVPDRRVLKRRVLRGRERYRSRVPAHLDQRPSVGSERDDVRRHLERIASGILTSTTSTLPNGVRCRTSCVFVCVVCVLCIACVVYLRVFPLVTKTLHCDRGLDLNSF